MIEIRFEALTARIEAAKSEAKPEEKAEDHHKAAQLAWRMVIELVAGPWDWFWHWIRFGCSIWNDTRVLGGLYDVGFHGRRAHNVAVCKGNPGKADGRIGQG